jgi:poly(beta-D-mannuronate) lyase
VSVDGVVWTTVDAGVSRGRGDLLEMRVWDSSISARYVKYVGFGNSDSGWNSIAEAVVLGPAGP